MPSASSASARSEDLVRQSAGGRVAVQCKATDLSCAVAADAGALQERRDVAVIRRGRLDRAASFVRGIAASTAAECGCEEHEADGEREDPATMTDWAEFHGYGGHKQLVCLALHPRFTAKVVRSTADVT
jgi:hypothetical protein